jgi:ATP-binding cassette, subfamily B, bacterial
LKGTLSRIAWDHRRPILLSLLTQVPQSIVGMMTVVLFQRLIDSLAAGAGSFESILCWYIGLIALNHLLIYAQEYPQRVAAVGTGLSPRLMAMGKLAVIDYAAYTGMDTGTTLQVVENGAEAASVIITRFWLFLAVTVLTLPVQLLLIRRYDPVLFFVVLGGYAVLFGVAQLLMRISQAAMTRVISRREELTRRIARAFIDLANLRVMRLFQPECRRAELLAREVIGAEGRIRLVNELFFTGFALLVSAVEVVVIVRQAVLIRAGASTVGTLAALVLFVRTVFAPISAFSFAWVQRRMSEVPWRRFQGFLDLPDDARLACGTRGVEPGDGDLQLVQVSYRISGNPILRGVSLGIRTGALTCIVGGSGSGKTTLVRAVLGLVKPQAGEVMVGGTPLSAVDLDAWHARIAFVSQDSPVLDGTVHENLLAGRSASEDVLRRAMRAALIDAVVDGRRLGLDTPVGERGINLSGGERQRIALARVLVAKPALVILDEPTSAMDADTEQRVMASLLAELRGRTVLLVSHRLQPVRAADAIHVMEAGTIVESGTFDQLMTLGGRFKALWEEQTRR